MNMLASLKSKCRQQFTIHAMQSLEREASSISSPHRPTQAARSILSVYIDITGPSKDYYAELDALTPSPWATGLSDQGVGSAQTSPDLYQPCIWV